MRLCSTGLVTLLVVIVACGETSSAIVDAAMVDGRGDGSVDPIDAPSVVDASVVDASATDAVAATDAIACSIGPNDLTAALLTVTTDDNIKIWLNGALVDDTARVWSNPQRYAVMIYRHPSQHNLLAVEGVNLQNQAGYDRGILVDLRFAIDGVTQTIVSDASFVATNTLTAGWEQPGFNDSAWSAAVNLGAVGIPPWGAVFSSLAPGSTASWIWTYDPALAIDKPQVESTYARRTFAVIDPACSGSNP
jgi:hypothetical protein